MPIKPPPRRIPQKILNDPELQSFFRELIDSVYQLFFFASEFSGSEIFDITATGGVTYHKRVVRVVGDGGAVTVTATPSIAAITDGKEIIIQGTDDTNTVTLRDESNLANSGLALAGGADITLGKGDMIYLSYSEEDSKFYEISRSNN